MRFPLVAVLLLIVSITAGCVDDEPPAPAGNASPGGASDGDGGGTDWSGTTQGPAPGPTGAPSGSSGAIVAAPQEPEVETRSGAFLVKSYPPLGAPIATGEGHQFDIRFDANVTGIVLILEWTAATPLTNELEVWVHSASAIGSDFFASGPSPLRLPMAATDAVEPGYVVDILPPQPARTGVNQEFEVTLARFTGMPFDPEWAPEAAA